MALINKDLSSVEIKVMEEIALLKPGWYSAGIEDSEIKQGAKGDYIAWTFSIIGFPNFVWDNMSLSNDIGCERLKALAVAVNYPTPDFIEDTEWFHGKEVSIKVGIKKDKTGTYADQNSVKMFKAFEKVENNSTNFDPQNDPNFWK